MVWFQDKISYRTVKRTKGCYYTYVLLFTTMWSNLSSSKTVVHLCHIVHYKHTGYGDLAATPDADIGEHWRNKRILLVI